MRMNRGNNLRKNTPWLGGFFCVGPSRDLTLRHGNMGAEILRLGNADHAAGHPSAGIAGGLAVQIIFPGVDNYPAADN